MPTPPYVLDEIHETGCQHCGAGERTSWNVLNEDGSTLCTYDNRDEAELDRDRLNDAWLAGWNAHAQSLQPRRVQWDRLDLPSDERRAGWSARFYRDTDGQQVQPYRDPGGAIPAPMPLIADSRGNFHAVWLPTGNYRVKFCDQWGAHQPLHDRLENTEIPF